MHKILDEKAEIVKVINSNINKIPWLHFKTRDFK